jgi:hypothetical protein
VPPPAHLERDRDDKEMQAALLESYLKRGFVVKLEEISMTLHVQMVLSEAFVTGNCAVR